MSPVHVLQMSPVQVLQVQSSPAFTTCHVFGFKTAENCQDAQNLPSVTVSKAVIGQIFPQNGVFTLAEKSGQ